MGQRPLTTRKFKNNDLAKAKGLHIVFDGGDDPVTGIASCTKPMSATLDGTGYVADIIFETKLLKDKSVRCAFTKANEPFLSIESWYWRAQTHSGCDAPDCFEPQD